MEVTGEERILLPNPAEIRYEHWHRYLYATRFSGNRKVLDVACGEGYGSQLLSLNAQTVIGVDMSQEAIGHAASKHIRDNLEFKVGSVGRIPIEGAGIFDLIVSFDTIEHLNSDEQNAFLVEAKRLLKQDGLFIVSTPNKPSYADLPRNQNQFQVREFSVSEFRAFLRQYFPHVSLLGQKIYPVSYIWIPGTDEAQMREYRLRGTGSGFTPTSEEKESLYTLGLCSGRPIDGDASVMVDLNETIFRLNAQRIGELESTLKGNAAALADRDTRIKDLECAVEEFERALEDRERALEEKEAQIQQIQSGHGWKLLTKYYKFRERLLPSGTTRRRLSRTIFTTTLSAARALRRITTNPQELIHFHTSPSQTPLIFDNLSDYADTILLPENPGYLLVVDDQVPSPDKDAGSVRMYAMLKLLREMNFAITFVVSSSESPSRDSERKLERLRIPLLYGYSTAVAHLARHGHQYEFVLLSRPEVALRFLPAVRAYAINSTVIYDTVDLHWVRFHRAAALSGDPALAREADRFQRMERLNAVCADLVLAVTQEDKDNLLAVAPDARVEVIPTIHTIMPPSDLGQQRKGLMFVGNFQHGPNVDAVKWFVTDVFPLIQRQLTGIVFHVVGSRMPKEVTTLASPSVRIAGYVPDLDPAFRSSKVFVAPLRYGSGMKGKIGQSMSYGLPVVTTSIGAEGIMLQDGETALIADSPEAFAQAVVRLYTDDLLWKKIADNSLEHVRQHFSEEAITSRLATIFASLRGGSRTEASGTERAA